MSFSTIVLPGGIGELPTSEFGSGTLGQYINPGSSGLSTGFENVFNTFGDPGLDSWYGTGYGDDFSIGITGSLFGDSPNFNITFEDVNDVFSTVGKNLLEDVFTNADLQAAFNNLGNSENFIRDAFGEDGLIEFQETGQVSAEDYYNPSKVIKDTVDYYSGNIGGNQFHQIASSLQNNYGYTYDEIASRYVTWRAIQEGSPSDSSTFNEFLQQTDNLYELPDFVVQGNLDDDVKELTTYKEFLQRVGIDEALADYAIQDENFSNQLNGFLSDVYSNEADLMPPLKRARLIAENQPTKETFQALIDEKNSVIRQQNRESFFKQQDRFRGFVTEEEYQNWKAKSDDALYQADFNARQAAEAYMQSDNYQGEFHDSNGQYRQELLDDYTSGRYYDREITQEEVNKAKEKIDLTLGLSSGESATNSGKVLAIALDLIGLGGSSKLYLTQTALNATINAVEGVINRIADTNIDLPNFNIHEMVAELINKKFVKDDGTPVLESVGNKISYLFPLYDPTYLMSAGEIGSNLGKYSADGEGFFDNIVDVLFEGRTMDRVQELSAEGRFENIDLGERRSGIMGFVDSTKQWVQSIGVAGQKLFGPTVSQLIIDNAFFGGLPISPALNDLAVSLSPQTAEEWVQWARNKGLDENEIKEEDISFWREQMDQFLNTPKSNGITTWEEMMTERLEDEGLVANYISSLNSWLNTKVGKDVDQMGPNDLLAIMASEVADQTLTDNAFGRTDGQSFGTIDLGNGFVLNADVVKTISNDPAFEGYTADDFDQQYNWLLQGGFGESPIDSGTYTPTTDADYYRADTVTEDVYVIPDFEVIGYDYEVAYGSDNQPYAIDTNLNLAYQYNPTRVLDDGTYAFPELEAEHLIQNGTKLNAQRLKELVNGNRMKIGEAYKYALANPLAFTNSTNIRQLNLGILREYDSNSELGRLEILDDGTLVKVLTQVDASTGQVFATGTQALTQEEITQYVNGEYLYNNPEAYAKLLFNDMFKDVYDDRFAGLETSDSGEKSLDWHLRNVEYLPSPYIDKLREDRGIPVDDPNRIPYEVWTNPKPGAPGAFASGTPNDNFMDRLVHLGLLDDDYEFTPELNNVYDFNYTPDVIKTTYEGDYTFIPNSRLEADYEGGGLVVDNLTNIVYPFMEGNITADNKYIFPILDENMIYGRQMLNPYSAEIKDPNKPGYNQYTNPWPFQTELLPWVMTKDQVDDFSKYGVVTAAGVREYQERYPVHWLGDYRPDFQLFDPSYTLTPGDLSGATIRNWETGEGTLFAGYPTSEPHGFSGDPYIIEGNVPSPFEVISLVDPNSTLDRSGEGAEDYGVPVPGGTDEPVEVKVPKVPYFELPNFTVNAYEDMDSLQAAYWERYLYIESQPMSYRQREAEQDSLYNQVKNRIDYLNASSDTSALDTAIAERDEARGKLKLLEETGREEDLAEIRRLEGIEQDAVARISALENFKLPDFNVTTWMETDGMSGTEYMDSYLESLQTAVDGGLLSLYNQQLLVSGVSDMITSEINKLTKEAELSLKETESAQRLSTIGQLEAANKELIAQNESLNFKFNNLQTQYGNVVTQRDDAISDKNIAERELTNIRNVTIPELEAKQFVQLDDFTVTAYATQEELDAGFSQYQDYLNGLDISQEQKDLALSTTTSAYNLQSALLESPYQLPDLQVTEDMSKDEFNSYLDNYETILENNVAPEDLDNVKGILDTFRSTRNAAYDEAEVQAGLLVEENRKYLIEKGKYETADALAKEWEGKADSLETQLGVSLAKEFREIASFDPSGAGITDDVELLNSYNSFVNSINSNTELSEAQRSRELDIAKATYDYYSEIIEAPFVLPDYNVVGDTNSAVDARAYEENYLDNLESLIGQDGGISQEQYDKYSVLIGNLTESHISKLQLAASDTEKFNKIKELEESIVQLTNIDIPKLRTERDEARTARDAAESRIEELQLFNLPDFNVTATNDAQLNDYIDGYIGEIDTALQNGLITAAQATDLRSLVEEVRTNTSSIFAKDSEINQKATTIKTLNEVTIPNLRGQITTQENRAKLAESERDNYRNVVIPGLEAQLYVEIPDFSVTASDVAGAEAEFNAFISNLESTDMTEEQLALESSLAQNTLDLFKETKTVAELQGFTLPDFVVTATNDEELNTYIDGYLTQVDQAVTDGLLTSEQSASIKSIAERVRTDRSQVFAEKAVSAEKQNQINTLEQVTIPELESQITSALSYLDLGTFDPMGADIADTESLDTAYGIFIQAINDNPHLSEAQKQNEINIAQATYEYYQEIIKSPFILDDYVVTGYSTVEATDAYHQDFLSNLQSLVGTDDGITQEEYDRYETLLGGMRDAHVSNINYAITEAALRDDLNQANANYEAKDKEAEDLRKLLYVELDDFVVNESLDTAPEDQYNDFVTGIDAMVAAGNLTSEQGELEKSLAKNSYDLHVELGNVAALTNEVTGLQTYVLPDFNVTAANQQELDTYLNNYLGFVDQAVADGYLTNDQSLSIKNIVEDVRVNGTSAFALEELSNQRLIKIGEVEAERDGYKQERDNLDTQLTSMTGNYESSQLLNYAAYDSFDPSSATTQEEVDTMLADFTSAVGSSDLSDGQKQSEIDFANKLADLYRQDLFVPDYTLPDFSTVASGDLSGLDEARFNAIFELNNYFESGYISSEEYNTYRGQIQDNYQSQRDVIVPTYTLPDFTVSALDADGTYESLEAEYVSIVEDLQFNYLDKGYITVTEYNELISQLDNKYLQQREDITPAYELPDFDVFAVLGEGETFEELDKAYQDAKTLLDNNAQLGYMQPSEYVGLLQQLEISYDNAKQRIAPTYTLPDFSAFDEIPEGSDFSAIDTAYDVELQKLNDYLSSGFIGVNEYYNYLQQLDSAYTTRRAGISPTYQLPDFGVVGTLTETEDLYAASLARMQSFLDQGYFEEGFDVLGLQQQLLDLSETAKARLRGTYVLPDFVVEDEKGLLLQDDIQDLFDQYEETLQQDVMSGMLDFSAYAEGMDIARGIFDTEYDKRKPLKPIGPGLIDFGDDQFFPDYADGDGGFGGDVTDIFDTPTGGTGVATGGTIGGNYYMAKLDPAYQLAEMLLGEAGAKDLFPTGKSRGLADEQFQEVVNQFMLGQAEDAFEMQAGLAGKQQDLADRQRRLRRESDINLMQEFGGQYKKSIEELYPEGAEALQQQAAISKRRAEEASGDLTPQQQARAEQQAYLFGAQRGREYDPITMMTQLGEEENIRQQRDVLASSMATQTANMERGFYGDLPSVIGAESPFVQGVGQVTTPFNIAGIMDLGTVDYANQQKLQEAQMSLSNLQSQYNRAVAMNEPSKAQQLLVQMQTVNETITGLSAGLKLGQEAFGVVGDIFQGFGNLFGGSGKSSNQGYSTQIAKSAGGSSYDFGLFT